MPGFGPPAGTICIRRARSRAFWQDLCNSPAHATFILPACEYTMAAAALGTPSISLSMLFARYVRGEIGDAIWSRLMLLLDDGDVTGAERLALASFVGELIAEAGPSALALLGDVRPITGIRRGETTIALPPPCDVSTPAGG